MSGIRPGEAVSIRSGPLGIVAFLVLGVLPTGARSQISPQQVTEIQNTIAARVDALTILGGDFGLSDGKFHSTSQLLPGANSNVDTSVTKFGGDGDVGDPAPVGDLNLGWQPRVQGNMGFLDSSYHLMTAPLAGDTSELKTFAIEFGGGVRLWATSSLSLAPTLMVLYSHTSDSYSPQSAFALANLPELKQLGLIDWNVDTWSLRPALNVQYIVAIDRALVTFSSDPTGFLTHGFAGSNVHVGAGGNSGFVTNKVDLDIPIGVELFGHEVRSGGYVSRTDLFGELNTGLDVQHLNELHARIVLDFLNQLWKVQWLGVGASYLWGTNITGWTLGADAAFRF